SLASTGVVVGAVAITVAMAIVLKHSGHRLDGIAAIIQLAGALLTVPVAVRKLLPSRPRLSASMLAGARVATSSEPRWVGRGGFRLRTANLWRACLRRWRRALVLGVLTFGLGIGFSFLAPGSTATAIVLIVLLSLGLLFSLFGLYAMVLPRRFHAPLSSETEILSPLQLAADERFQGALGIVGLVLVLGSIMLKFVALYA